MQTIYCTFVTYWHILGIMIIIMLSPGAWDQRNHQGDKLVFYGFPDQKPYSSSYCIKHLFVTLFELLHQIMQLLDTTANKL